MDSASFLFKTKRPVDSYRTGWKRRDLAEMQLYLQWAANWVSQNWLILSIFAAMSLLGIVRSRQRQREWVEVARSKNLQWLGTTLPSGLSLDGTSLSGSGFKVEEVIAGELEGIHIVAFNLSDRRGDDRINQTIVAFPMDGLLLSDRPPQDPTGSYRFELTGNWLLAWLPTRQIAPEELQDWCLDLYNLAVRLIGESRTGSNESGKLASRLFREF